MDLSIFVPLLDSLTQILSQVDGKWASIVVLVLLLVRAGVLKFPVKIPFLTPKTPAAPTDPSKPIDPVDAPKTPDVATPLIALGDLLKQWLAERLKARFGELLDAGHTHDEAFTHLAASIKTDPAKPVLPLANEVK